MENTLVFVNKTGVLKNTRVFFVKYRGIFQYPGNMTLHRGLLSKPNQEPPFCDMQSIDQLPIS